MNPTRLPEKPPLVSVITPPFKEPLKYEELKDALEFTVPLTDSALPEKEPVNLPVKLEAQ
jgi:hypothetical protein